MANFKKELKAVMARFDAAHDAFTEGTTLQQKNKKKLKSAKAKIRSLEEKIASLEQQLKVIKDDHTTIMSSADTTETTPKKASSKRTGSRRSSSKKAAESPTDVSAEEMAEAVSEAPDTVSEAAAETPQPRRGRPRKTTGAAKAARKSASAKEKAPAKDKATAKAKAPAKAKGTRGRGRPSTKPAQSELTKIHGVGATMAKRFEEAGVNTVDAFANLSDDAMSEVLQQCGPRYRNADHEKMESYRQAARETLAA